MMPTLSAVLTHVRRTAAHEAGPSDAELLQRFAVGRDEAAFELLVWRHGPLVLGTCRRALGDAHAAEDAFQATFLALARRASSIRRGASVAAWLHRVAARAAQAVGRRMACEQSFDGIALASREPEPADAASLRELRRALDEAVDRLPARYREPLVLTCLAGRSHAEVARELGCAVRTVESRVGRARQRLRAALARRGFVPATALAATLVPADGGVAAPLVAAAVRAAVSGAVPGTIEMLTQGVLHAMLLSKLKVAGMVVLVAGAIGLGAGSWAFEQGPADVSAKPQPANPARPKSDRRERVRELIRELGESLNDPDVAADATPKLREMLKAADERKAQKEARDRTVADQIRIIRLALAAMRRATDDDPERRRAVADFEAEVARLEARLRAGGDAVQMLPVGDPRGKVLRIDGELVTISIDSDADVRVGNKLHLYRLRPIPEYVGDVTILATTPHQAIGRVKGPKGMAVVVGDEVAAGIPPG